MEFRQLRSFIALVECQSFTLAAKTTYVSQPTISIHLQTLENELQTQLVIRDSKNIAFTERGKQFYQFAKQIIRLEDSLKDSWRPTTNVINLGTSSIPSAYLLPNLLQEFAKTQPNVEVKLTQDDSASIIQKVLAGIFDVGIVGMNADNSEIICLPFASDRMVLITPNSKRFTDERSERLSASSVRNILQEYPFIVREEGSGSGYSAKKVLEQLELVPDLVHIGATVSNQESLVNFVANNMGVALISNLAAEDAARSKNIKVFELPVNSRRVFYAATRTYSAKPPQVEAFLQLLSRSGTMEF